MWTIYLRDELLQRRGQLGDFQRFEAISRFNAVGTWSVTLDARTAAAALLVQPGWGVELVRDDTDVVFSGTVNDNDESRKASEHKLTLVGVDDMVCLRDKLAHPCPAVAAPPYSVQEEDVQATVPGSTSLIHYADHNAGPNAIAPRRTYGLTMMAPDPVLGSTITSRGRWQNLLEFLQGEALKAGGLGFRVAKTGVALEFQVYEPEDKSGTVKFSIDNGSLAEYSYGQSAPSANYTFVGGGGEGVARVVREWQDPEQIIHWRRRIETFVDQRHTSVEAELDSEGQKVIAEGKGKQRLSVTPTDIRGAAYLTDYQLGDTVSAILNGAVLVDVVREMTITLEPGQIRLKPSIGTPDSSAVLNTFKEIRKLRTRIAQLERS